MWIKPKVDNRVHLHHYGDVPANLNYSDVKSIGEVIFDSCETYHDYVALKYILSGNVHTENYTKFAEQIELAAKMLKLNGINKGDRIMVLLPFLPEDYHIIYAIAAVGATAVPIHPEIRVKSQLIEQIREVNPKMIICLDRNVQLLDSIFSEYKQLGERIHKVLYVKPVDSFKMNGIASVINPIIDYKYQKSGEAPEKFNLTSNKFASYRAEINSAKNYQGTYMANVKPEDDYAIYYTSGTSGKKPAGIILSHANSFAYLKSGTAISNCVEPGDSVLNTPGPFHCFGAETGRNVTLASGATQIIVPDPKKFKEIAAVMKSEKPSHVVSVPKLLNLYKESGLFDDICLDFVKSLICGGGKMGTATSEYWNAKLKHTQIREGYGSTQLCGGICINTKTLQIPRTIGIPAPDVYFMLKDPETGEIINEPNKPGELYVSSPTLMKGLLGNPNPDCLITDEDGVIWYKTNDLVSYDENGWYTFIDRCDDIINLDSGNLVNPSKIEDILDKRGLETYVIFQTNNHPKNQGADRIIVAIEYAGDLEDIKLLQEVLEKDFADNLNKYEIPAEITVMDRLPINGNGKYKKRETIDKYFDGEFRLNLVLNR